MKRPLVALRTASLAGVALLLIGLADHFSGWPLVTGTLGPTAYYFFVRPGPRWSLLRTAAIGHGVGIGGGLAGLWLTGSWRIGNVFLVQASTLPHVYAVAIAIVITLFVLHVIDAHHPPAAATTVLVASGLAGPGRLLAGLALGLLALSLLQLGLNRVPAPN